MSNTCQQVEKPRACCAAEAGTCAGEWSAVMGWFDLIDTLCSTIQFGIAGSPRARGTRLPWRFRAYASGDVCTGSSEICGCSAVWRGVQLESSMKPLTIVSTSISQDIEAPLLPERLAPCSYGARQSNRIKPARYFSQAPRDNRADCSHTKAMHWGVHRSVFVRAGTHADLFE